MSKYRSKKITVGGITFDSKKEAARYQELCFMQKAGEIKDLKRQVKFVLIPSQREKLWNAKKNCYEDGKVIEREVSYVADFVYTNRLGFVVVEDTKGFKTKDYIIKRKLMLYFHRIRIQEI